MIKPLPSWASSLEEKLVSTMEDANKNGQASSQVKLVQAWQDFLDENVQGIEVAAPYSPCKGTTNKMLFNPLPLFGKEKTPIQVAQKFANAWETYMMGIQWVPPPPPPPFSAIISVSTSPAGIAIAYPKLMSQLIAEFSKPPKKGQGPQKYQNLAKIFYSATLGIGVQISGLGIGSPPPPLILPKVPTL